MVERVAVEHGHAGTLGEERVGVGLRDDGLEHLAAGAWVDLLVHLHHLQLLVRGGEVLNLLERGGGGGVGRGDGLIGGGGNLVEESAPVVRNDELRRARLLEDADAGLDSGAPLLHLGPAPIHPSVELVELPLELVEPKLERGIHGVDRESNGSDTNC